MYDEYKTMKNVFHSWKVMAEVRSEKNGMTSLLKDQLIQRFYEY